MNHWFKQILRFLNINIIGISKNIGTDNVRNKNKDKDGIGTVC